MRFSTSAPSRGREWNETTEGSLARDLRSGPRRALLVRPRSRLGFRSSACGRGRLPELRVGFPVLWLIAGAGNARNGSGPHLKNMPSGR